MGYTGTAGGEGRSESPAPGKETMSIVAIAVPSVLVAAFVAAYAAVVNAVSNA